MTYRMAVNKPNQAGFIGFGSGLIKYQMPVAILKFLHIALPQ